MNIKSLIFLGVPLFSLTLVADTLGFVEQKFSDLNFEKARWNRTVQLPCYTYTALDNGAVVEVLRMGTSNLVPFKAAKGLKVMVCGSTAAFDEGFRKLVQSGLSLQINQQARLDLTLQLGQVSETVEVTAQTPLLESESSSLGTVVNEQLVNQLPLNGRNFIQLATLSPGVNGAISSSWAPGCARASVAMPGSSAAVGPAAAGAAGVDGRLRSWPCALLSARP